MFKQSNRSRAIPGGYQAPFNRASVRRQFFSAIKRHCSEVLDSLRANVLPVFYRVHDTPNELPSNFNDILVVATWSWARKFHLVGDPPWAGEQVRNLPTFIPSPDVEFFFSWVYWAAYGTLQAWSQLTPPKREEELDWTLPCRDWNFIDWCYESNQAVVESLFESNQSQLAVTHLFHYTDWHPLRETRAQTKKRILEEVCHQLDKKLDQAETLFCDMGFEKAQRVTALEHFDWLAKYQVQELPFAKIARHSGLVREQKTVAHGVKSAAELVIGPGWQHWLRPGKPGRPRKS